jgi:hypothetical protein
VFKYLIPLTPFSQIGRRGNFRNFKLIDKYFLTSIKFIFQKVMTFIKKANTASPFSRIGRRGIEGDEGKQRFSLRLMRMGRTAMRPYKG